MSYGIFDLIAETCDKMDNEQVENFKKSINQLLNSIMEDKNESKKHI